MQAGKLNRRVTIQAKNTVADSYGQMIETWTDSRTTWAEVITKGGTEFYAAQKLNASTDTVFRVRYNDDITVLNRLKYGTRIFEILGINEVNGMRTELLLSCREVA